MLIVTADGGPANSAGFFERVVADNLASALSANGRECGFRALSAADCDLSFRDESDGAVIAVGSAALTHLRAAPDYLLVTEGAIAANEEDELDRIEVLLNAVMGAQSVILMGPRSLCVAPLAAAGKCQYLALPPLDFRHGSVAPAHREAVIVDHVGDPQLISELVGRCHSIEGLTVSTVSDRASSVDVAAPSLDEVQRFGRANVHVHVGLVAEECRFRLVDSWVSRVPVIQIEVDDEQLELRSYSGSRVVDAFSGMLIKSFQHLPTVIMDLVGDVSLRRSLAKNGGTQLAAFEEGWKKLSELIA